MGRSHHSDSDLVNLDRTMLKDLAGLHDENGVLSIYVTADPREETSTRPAWRIRIGNQLNGLRERLADDPDRPYAKWALRRISELTPRIQEVLATRTSGLGRAMFAPLSEGGEVRMISVQLPLDDLVVMDTAAYVRPLVEATEVGAPAGVCLVSKSGLRMVDMRYGLADEAGGEDFELDVEERRTMRGPGGMDVNQRSSAHRDQFASRVDDNLLRLVRAAAKTARTASDRLHWEAIVVTGEPKLTEPFVAALAGPDDLPIVVCDEELAHRTPAELAAAVTPRLNELRGRLALDRATATKDAALGGGRGVLGLADTLAALRGGVVGRLFLDTAREWEGARSADGQLYTVDGVPPGVNGLIPEQRMGERMIEAALLGGSRVTMLDPTLADPITDYDGVAAQLRW